jgi:Flp pilus assembly pilin Flp
MGECEQNRCSQSRNRRLFSTVLSDSSGAVFVEYVVVLALVTLVGAGAIALVGVPLLESYQLTQLLITLPIP